MCGVEGRDVGEWGWGVGCVYNGGLSGCLLYYIYMQCEGVGLSRHLVTEFWEKITHEQIIFSWQEKKWALLRKRWHIDCLVCASRTPGFRHVLPYIYVEEVQQCTSQSWRGEGGEKLKCHVRLESLPQACFSWSSQCDPKTWSGWWFLRGHYDKAPPSRNHTELGR